MTGGVKGMTLILTLAMHFAFSFFLFSFFIIARYGY